LFCGDAIADPLTGLAAAVLAAGAVASGEAASGALIDVAMADIVAATLSPHEDEGQPSLAARRTGDRWVVESAAGPVDVAAVKRRQARGRAAGLGEHTAEVLAQLGLRAA
jgi:hypothetical protein